MITMKTFWTLLAAGLTIVSASRVDAQWTDRGTLTRLISGVAMSPAGSTTSRTATVEGAAASHGFNANKDGSPNKKALVGSWLETVTFPPESGRPPLKSLVSFHDDETTVTSDQGSVTTDPPSVFSSGQGAWTHLEKRTFAYTLLELISDLSGNLVGFLKVRGVYVVTDSGNEYNGTSFAEVSDTDGNVLFSVDVTNAGRRIQVELP